MYLGLIRCKGDLGASWNVASWSVGQFTETRTSVGLSPAPSFNIITVYKTN